jgi:hypothetical protein
VPGGVWVVSFDRPYSKQAGIERVALVVASLCQGVKHFGRNNAFCLATKHGLAMLCNDMHVLENMHTSMCFAILYSCGMLPNLQRDSYERLRSHVIELIISTDMSAHFSLVAKFRIRGIGSQFSCSKELDRRLLAQM